MTNSMHTKLTRYRFPIAATAVVTIGLSIVYFAGSLPPITVDQVVIGTENKAVPKSDVVETWNHAFDVAPTAGSTIETLKPNHESLPEWKPEAYASSLAGTDIDGKLSADAQGNLQLTIDVKDFFDYFFSAVGEVSLEDAVAEIEKQSRYRLPEKAHQQVMDLLEQYMAYQHAIQDVMAMPLLPADKQNYQYYSDVMTRTLAQIKQLRRDYFSPAAADAFFALEERYSEYAVASMRIRADETLTTEEKQAKVAELDKTMPEQMQLAQAQAEQTAALANEARRLYEQGVDKSAIVDVLDEQYDTQTVQNMLSFYDREDKWQQRLSEFMVMKANLDQANLDDDEHRLQLEALRENYFTEDELPRLLSHEAITRKQAGS